MSKILDWIKKHVWQTGLIGFGLFILPLILVHVAYRVPAISPWFASTWQAGELITYIAGFMALFGTVVLGAIAIHQNDKENEEKRDIFGRQASVMLINHEIYIGPLKDFELTKSGVFQCIGVPYFKIPDNECILTLTLVNSSNSFTILKAVAIDSFLDINIHSAFHCLMNCVCKQKTSLIDIAPGKECKLHIATTLEEYQKFGSAVLNLRLQLTNSIGETRNERISFILVKLHDDVFTMNTIRYFFDENDNCNI
jgi:hypothetical protein